MGPRAKPQPKDEHRPVMPAEDVDGADKIAPVDGEAYLHWLETGEGDPWRDSSD